jgi:hypothetical protein
MRGAVALTAVLMLAATAGGTQATFPLIVDYATLGAALQRQLPGAASDGAVLWGTRGGCRSLVVRDVRFEPANGRVRLVAQGAARLGFNLLGFCIAPVTWDGYLEALSTPEIGRDWLLRLRDVDSHLYDRRWRRSGVSGRLWEVVKGRFESEVAAFVFDLGPPIDEARALLRASVGPARAAPVLAGLETLRPLEVQAEPDGIKVRVALDVSAPGPPSLPEPPLAPQELEQWRAALERWDAFLVFVIKDLGVLDQSRGTRDQLLELLLSGRHALLAALAGGPEVGVDPVRQLFLDAWEQFRSIARQAAARGTLEDHATRYLTFLTAGDALAALDAAAPWLGLEISADGLRRLARVLEPEYVGDPLAYSEAADAVLRELFDFHEPTSSEPGPPDAGWWPGLGTAWAAASSPGQLSDIARRLDRWVPEQQELGEYRDAVARLLAGVATRTAEVNAVEQRFRGLYDDLVRATAWQESCWRQFVRRGGEVTYLLSQSGDIGMMQVNRRVWRGFFDLQKLEWDAAYNAGAGAEILAQLLGRYGVREAGRLENAARATYAAYNGGPGAYRRYRLTQVPRRLRAIDRAFWEKFRAMAAGQGLDYVLCVTAWTSSRDRLSIAPSGSTPK